jgi:hypothetical protein
MISTKFLLKSQIFCFVVCFIVVALMITVAGITFIAIVLTMNTVIMGRCAIATYHRM